MEKKEKRKKGKGGVNEKESWLQWGWRKMKRREVKFQNGPSIISEELVNFGNEFCGVEGPSSKII